MRNAAEMPPTFIVVLFYIFEILYQIQSSIVQQMFIKSICRFVFYNPFSQPAHSSPFQGRNLRIGGGEKRTILKELHSFSTKLPKIFKLTCSLPLVCFFFFSFFFSSFFLFLLFLFFFKKKRISF